MSIEDVTSYADIYDGNLTHSDMKYLDDLGVEWRGRNVLEVRDEICMKAMHIFSQAYQQVALTNPSERSRLRTQIIQSFSELLADPPDNEDEPFFLTSHFDPISGTYREIIAAEGWFKRAIQKTTKVISSALPIHPPSKNLAQGQAVRNGLLTPITKPIEKAETKVGEWVQEHPVAATVIVVATVATLIATLGPAGASPSEAIVEAVTAAGAAAAASSDKSNKNVSPPKKTPPQDSSPYVADTVGRLKEIGSGLDDILQSSTKVAKEYTTMAASGLLHTTGDLIGGTREMIGQTQDLFNKVLHDPSNHEQEARDNTKAMHEKIDAMLDTNQASLYDPEYARRLPMKKGEIPFLPGAASLLGRAAQVASTELNVARTSAVASTTLEDLALLERERLAVQEARTATGSSNGFVGNRAAGFELKNLEGTGPRNAPAVINNRQYRDHALDQMQNRGFSPSAVEQAIEKGVKTPDPRPGRIRCYDLTNNFTVIIEENGEVVTVMPGRR